MDKNELARLLEIITHEAESDEWRRFNHGFGNWDIVVPGKLKWECQYCRECCKGDESKVIDLRDDVLGICKELMESGCKKYEDRPVFCRVFPFRIIRTRGANGELVLIACSRCPGIGKGRTIGIREYLHILTYWSTEEMWTEDDGDEQE